MFVSGVFSVSEEKILIKLGFQSLIQKFTLKMFVNIGPDD